MGFYETCFDSAILLKRLKVCHSSSTYLFDIVRHNKDVRLFGHVWLDLRVGVVDDSQEHVDEDEEDKEDKQHEEDWTQDTIGLLQLVEVKVTQDNSKQREAGGLAGGTCISFGSICINKTVGYRKLLLMQLNCKH